MTRTVQLIIWPRDCMISNRWLPLTLGLPRYHSNVSKYHVLLSPKFLDPIVINVPAVYATTYTPAFVAAVFGPPPDCGPLGVVDIGWFDNYVTSTLIPALAAKGVNPTTFPIFFVHNVVWAEPVTNLFTCCTLGYHGLTGFPTPTQTYSPVDYHYWNTNRGPQLRVSGIGPTAPCKICTLGGRAQLHGGPASVKKDPSLCPG